MIGPEVKKDTFVTEIFSARFLEKVDLLDLSTFPLFLLNIWYFHQYLSRQSSRSKTEACYCRCFVQRIRVSASWFITPLTNLILFLAFRSICIDLHHMWYLSQLKSWETSTLLIESPFCVWYGFAEESEACCETEADDAIAVEAEAEPIKYPLWYHEANGI